MADEGQIKVATDETGKEGSNLPDLASVIDSARNGGTVVAEATAEASSPASLDTPTEPSVTNPSPSDAQPPSSFTPDNDQKQHNYRSWIIRAAVVVAVIGLAGLGYLLVGSNKPAKSPQQNSATAGYAPTAQPLKDIASQSNIGLAVNDPSAKLTVNGALNINGGVVVSASSKPLNPTKGQMYFSQADNKLYFYNGTQFIDITYANNVDLAIKEAVRSLQGQTGAVTLTAGGGIAVNGTTITNSGVVSLESSSPSMTVTNGGNGHYIIGNTPGAGSVDLQSTTPGIAQTGNINVSGSVVAGSFLGDGSGLNSLNASSVASGTLASARLSTNVTLQGNIFNGAGQLVQLNGVSELPAANAVNLVNLNASSVATGTLADTRLSANVTVQGNIFNGASQLVKLTAAGYLPVLNGSLVNSLDAGNVATGTLADSRLSTNVALLNASQTFSGNNTFGGTVTAGTINSSGALVLQGNSSTTLKATSGLNSTTVGFAGIASGNISYNFDMSTTPGTYTICSTIGNCAGSGGGVTTLGGSTNKLAKFTGTASIGSSILTDTGTAVTITPGSNSTTTFNVQNSTSGNVLLVDTTNTRIAVGQGTATYTLDVNGDINTATALRVGGNLVCSSTGCSASGGSGYYVQNGTALQPGTNFNIQSVGAASVVGIVRGAVSQSADLFQAQNSGGVAVAKITAAGNLDIAGTYNVNGVQVSSANLSNDANLAKLNATQSFTGVNTFQNAANSTSAFKIQNALGTSNLFVADTTNTRIGIGLPAPGYTLDVNGDVNVAAGSLFRIGGTPICGQVTATCAPSSGSTYYIQNGTSLQPSANFSIQSGNAGSVVGILRGAASQTADLLQVQTATPSTVFSIGNTGVITFTGLGTADTATYLCRNSSNQLSSCSGSAGGAAFVNGGNSFGATAILGTSDANSLTIKTNNTSYFTLNTAGLLQGSNGATISAPGSGGGSERFGALANTSTYAYSTAIGSSASVTGDYGSAFGSFATATGVLFAGGTAVGYNSNAGLGSVAVGYLGTATGNFSTATGAVATASGASAIAIGNSSSATFNYSIALGTGAATTATNQLVAGNSSGPINDLYFGKGVTNTTPTAYTIHGTGGSGTDIAGADLRLAGGQGTGAGVGGSILIQTAAAGSTGTSNNALATVATFSGTNGSATFQNTVNSSSAFQVNGYATENPSATSLNGTLNSGAGSYTMGYIFTPNVSGNITQLGLRSPGTGTYNVRLYTSGGTLLTNANVTTTGVGGFFYTSITPVAVTAGTQYVVAMYTGGGSYGYVTSPSTFTVGNITVNQSVYATGTAFPTINGTSNFYGIPDITLSSPGNFLNVNTSSNYVNLLGNILSGGVGIGTTAPASRLQVNNAVASSVGVIVKGATTQTADLQQWQDTSGNVLLRVSAAGILGSTDLTTASAATTIRTGNSTSSGNTGVLTLKTGDSSGGTAGNIVIDNGSSFTGVSSILLGTSTGSARTINIGGTGINVSTSNASTTVAVQAGATSLNLTSAGGTKIQNYNGSTTAFQVLQSGGTDLFTVDTTNNRTILRGVNNNASAGSELLSGNCSGTGWTGTGSGPYTHTTGNSSNLICTVSGGVTASSMYQVTWSQTPSVSTTVMTPSVGGSSATGFPGSGTNSLIITTSNTIGLAFAISNASDIGTISGISIKLLSSKANPLLVGNYSNGSTGVELRVNNLFLPSLFLGLSSGQNNISGIADTGFGPLALAGNTTGLGNSAFGYASMQANTSGGSNTGIGFTALNNNTVGSYNTAVGGSALSGNTAGSNNTALGYAASSQDPVVSLFTTPATVNNTTTLGYGSIVQQSNSLILGGVGSTSNNLTPNVGIGTTMPTNLLSVSPDVYDTGTAGTAGVSSTVVTGSGTTWTSSMVGNEIVFADAQKATITAVSSSTSLMVNTAINELSGTRYRIHQPALQVTSTGNVGIGVAAPTANLQVRTQTNTTTALLVQRADSNTSLSVDTSTNAVTIGTGTVQGGVTGWTAGAQASPAGTGGQSMASATLVGVKYVYMLPGGSNTVYYAMQNGDGSLGTWTAGPVIPSLRYGAMLAVDPTNNYIYVIGGYASSISGTAAQGTVYYSSLNSGTGAPGTWVTSVNSLSTGVGLGAAFVNAGKLFVLGGATQVGGYGCSFSICLLPLTGTEVSTVQTSALTTGAPGAFGTTTAMPQALANFGMATDGSFNTWIFGGFDSTNTAATVFYRGAISAGAISVWTTLANGENNGGFGQTGAYANGYIYDIAYPNTKVSNGTSWSTMSGTNSNSAAAVAGNYIYTTLGSSFSIGNYNYAFLPSGATGLNITGNQTNYGTITQKNSFDSTAAFQVQSTSGADVLTADTTNSQLSVRGINSVATIGSELLSGNCSGTNWSGTGSGPYTHTAGSNVDLTCTITGGVVAGATYQVTYTYTPSITGTYMYPTIGGTNGLYASRGAAGYNNSIVLTTTTTANPTFSISNSADAGNITSISFMRVTTTNAVLQVKNSDATVALEVRSGGSGLNNTFVGLNSGTANKNATYNTGFGGSALQYTTSGGYNSAFGYGALQFNTTGLRNTALGYGAMQFGVSGYNNTAIGYAALQQNSVGTNNMAVGQNALTGNTSGSFNTAVGVSALQNNISNNYNVAIGYSALLNTVADANTAIGISALLSNSTGTNNTAVGYWAGNRDPVAGLGWSTLSGLSNATAIGYGAQVQQSNSLILGGIGKTSSNITPNVGIGTTMPSNLLSVSPNVYDTGTADTGGVASTTVTGTGTTWTAAMVGDEIVFMDGVKATITGFTNITTITVNTSITESPGTKYRIHQPALQVTSAGSVGIGVAAPTANLQVKTQTNTASAFQVQTSTGTNTFTVDTTAANNVAQFNGSGGTQCTVTTGTGWSCSSDERLKTNITAIDPTDALSKINRLQAVTFNWLSDPGGTQQDGFIAQAVQQILPELVSTDSNGYLSLNKDGILAYTVGAIQQQQKQITTLQTQVDSIQALQTNPTFASLNVSGNATLTNLTVTGNATVANLTVMGNLTTASLKVNGKIIGNPDTRGQLTITPGATTADYTFTVPYDEIPNIVATPTGNPGSQYWVSDITKTGFKVNLATAPTTDVIFNFQAQQ